MSQDPNDLNNNNNNNKTNIKSGSTKNRKRRQMGSISPLKETPERSGCGRGGFSRSNTQYSPNSPSKYSDEDGTKRKKWRPSGSSGMGKLLMKKEQEEEQKQQEKGKAKGKRKEKGKGKGKIKIVQENQHKINKMFIFCFRVFVFS